MTLAFDNFIKKLNSNGLQRLDGFDRSQFEGLDISELSKVEAMLEASAQKGSIVDINALGVLGTHGAKLALERTLSLTKENAEARIEALSSLLKLTRNNEYLEQLCCALRSKSEVVRLRAAIALRNADPCTRIFDEFWDLLKVETDSAIRSTVARGILRHYGLISKPQDPGLEYINIIRKLVSIDKVVRDEALKIIQSLSGSEK